MIDYPKKIANDKQLEKLLSRPTAEAVEMFRKLDGDIIFLGIAGKIGPSLANMAKRACDEAGVKKRIIGVSRFRDSEEKKQIESFGIETIQGDLLDRGFLESLPKVKNVFFLAGMKFGSEDNLSLTWAMNSYLPALVVEHFKGSRIVAYSTGCVYPFVPVGSGGSLEADMPQPVGEYAQSCLGRERMFEYGSKKNGTPVALIRLNYAAEPRYGVLVDIATKVKNNLPVDLAMGYFNVIWQGDANEIAIRSFLHCDVPANILNVTGPETLSIKWLAEQFGLILGKEPQFVNEVQPNALLSNASKAHQLFGYPRVTVRQMIEMTVAWLQGGGKTINKPTHFQERKGQF